MVTEAGGPDLLTNGGMVPNGRRGVERTHVEPAWWPVPVAMQANLHPDRTVPLMVHGYAPLPLFGRSVDLAESRLHRGTMSSKEQTGRPGRGDYSRPIRDGLWLTLRMRWTLAF
jgi:hypothetical protein